MVCQTSAVPATVRAEGLTERVGDIVFQCSNAPLSTTLTINFNFFVNAPVTNTLRTDGTLDIQMFNSIGAGEVLNPAQARLFGPSSISFGSVSVPTSSAGTFSLRMTNVRVSLKNFLLGTGTAPPDPVRVTVSTSVTVSASQLTVAFPQAALRGLIVPSIIDCRRTKAPPSPATMLSFQQANIPYFTTRVTEGFTEAFNEERVYPAYNGLRIRVAYNAVPEGLRLYVPDVVAGSTAASVTSAGDLGRPFSTGAHQPTPQGSLLLSRVINVNPDGSGGVVVFRPGDVGGPVVNFGNLTEVPVNAGAGEAIYEVVDANRGVLETAQIPTYGVPTEAIKVTAANVQASLSFAPLSTDTTASTSPIVRFLLSTPALDCDLLLDCSANYLPQLRLDTTKLDFSVPQLTNPKFSSFRVSNSGGGILAYQVRVLNGPVSWLRITPSGPAVGPELFVVFADPGTLPLGTYTATIEVDARPFGYLTIPVTLSVTLPLPRISAVQNAAALRSNTLAAGAIATLFGNNLNATNLSVTFDNVAAKIFYAGADQINLLVPPALGNRTESRVLVLADGALSNSFPVSLARWAPAIFPNAVLKADGTFPSLGNRADTGTALQVFATGLITNAPGQIVAYIHDRRIASPTFAGPAPGLDGVQQINFVIPSDLPSIPTEVKVCVTSDGSKDQEVCSPPVAIYLNHP